MDTSWMREQYNALRSKTFIRASAMEMWMMFQSYSDSPPQKRSRAEMMKL